MIAAYFPPILQESRQTIIECGGKLGSLVLWGRFGAHAAWEFQAVVTDWSVCALNDDEDGGAGPRRCESEWVFSWAAAVQLLDERRWEFLVPGTVHPEFRDETLAEVQRRLCDPSDERARWVRARWTAACLDGQFSRLGSHGRTRFSHQGALAE
jgi:hypothetical protein